MSTPSPYNLLELYRQHRDEIDAITDPTTLFILAYVNHVKHIKLAELAGELGLSRNALNKTLLPLYRGNLMTESAQTLSLTPLGKRVLDELGFGAPPIAPTEPPKQPPKPPAPPAAGTPGWLWSLIGFLSIAAVGLIGAIIIGALVLPGMLSTPTPPPLPTFAPPPTFTPVPSRPEVQIEFVADRTRLEPGECTILRWQVVGGFGVELDGRLVNRTGEMRVCPKESTRYELAVDVGDRMQRRTMTIEVIPSAMPEPTRTFTPTPSRTPMSLQILTPFIIMPTPTFMPTLTRTPTPDTQGPPAPTVLSPSGGTLIACSGIQALTWNSVSDPAGILRYEWVLERSTSGASGPYSSLASGNTTSLSATPAMPCGWWYRWRVRAVDRLGNVGAYSAYAYFSIGID